MRVERSSSYRVSVVTKNKSDLSLLEREAWRAVYDALVTEGYDSCKKVAAYYGLESMLKMTVAMMSMADPQRPDLFPDIIRLYAENIGKHPDEWVTL